ncbi:hypothetical protein FQK02_13760 [Xanthomonas vasicola]|nr:hypothetical protein FQK02_13760 [Xanthomonas vasicola]
MRRTTHVTAQPSDHPNALHPLLRLALFLSILALAYFPWLAFPWRMPLVGLIGLERLTKPLNSVESATTLPA